MPASPAKGFLLATATLLGVIGWQHLRAEHLQRVELRALTVEIVEWNAAQDIAARTRLQARLELRAAKIVDPAAVVSALPPALLDAAVGMHALERWKTQDRPAALRWMSEQSNPPSHRLAALLRGWALEDPAAAGSYVATLPEGAWKTRVLAGLARDALDHGWPQRALAFAGEMPASEQRDTLVRMAVATWAHYDSAAATKWTQHLPAGAMRAPAEAGLRAPASEE